MVVMGIASLLASLIITNACFCANVDVFIRNRTGIELKSAPVRGGIPFALSQLKKEQSLRLIDMEGKPLPLSARPIARWYDGSIKWLLVDTQVNLPAKGELVLQLKTSTNSEQFRKNQKIKVSETANAIVAETGAAQFIFERKQFSLPSAIWLDINRDGVYETRLSGPGSEFVCEIQHESPGSPNEENWLRNASKGPREKFYAAASDDYAFSLQNVRKSPVFLESSIDGKLLS